MGSGCTMHICNYDPVRSLPVALYIVRPDPVSRTKYTLYVLNQNKERDQARNRG